VRDRYTRTIEHIHVIIASPFFHTLIDCLDSSLALQNASDCFNGPIPDLPGVPANFVAVLRTASGASRNLAEKVPLGSIFPMPEHQCECQKT
jgi:hypothetical protein